MEEIDFETDSFADIIAKDDRYNPRAYALLMNVIRVLGGDNCDRHMTGEDILDEFREMTLDQFGPLSYRVLVEWGVKSTEDVGEMIFNLAESHRIGKDEGDTAESFAGGFNFEEAFLGPYAV